MRASQRALRAMAAKKKESFEQGLKKLEKLVDALEEGELGLEEGVDRYQKGVEILKELHASLAKAETKVEEMTAVLREGISDLEEDSGDEDAKD